jgi:microcystin-dependent protein
MPLARLENFLKNLNGNTLYVDPNELDSTDSIENRGNSRTRPFKTIQRALIEAARFSYVAGSNNDLFDQTTILIAPGTHYIDNRPGYYYTGSVFKDINNNTIVGGLSELSISSNFDINSSSNDLYKYNSASGGVIIPKGVSLVATDLRKTKIRPKFVPDPINDNIGRTAIFKVTGSSYIFGFTIFDGNPVGSVYNTYSSNTVNPTYSHHKLTAFEYADGKNVLSNSPLTDLQNYYYKVSIAYGTYSGRIISPDNFTNLAPNPEENKIVGDLGQGFINIEQLISGDGSTASKTITVTTEEEHGLSPLTPIQISGVAVNATEQVQQEFNGSFVVAQVISTTQFTYLVPTAPSAASPTVTGSTVKVLSDTVSSSSPYIFNCSLKSVYGMNGLHADGSKATGFKSIVTAQFTGISLQKDNRAFVKYDSISGTYKTQTGWGSTVTLHQDSTSLYRPTWENFHIKASNDSFIQCVSIFAIGYAKQFVAESGGDQSITNSNSNFGAVSLQSVGFKEYQLPKDNHSFITHIIPPKDIDGVEDNINCFNIDSDLTQTLASSNSNTRIYLKGYTDLFTPPKKSIRGYTIGARDADGLYYSGYASPATISPNYEVSYNIDSIDPNTKIITVESTIADIVNGQAVRVISGNAILPDGVEYERVYYAQNVTSNTLQLSENVSGSTIVNLKNDKGNTVEDNLRIVSRVVDCQPGDPGSPFQWDSTNNNWYVKVQTATAFISSLNPLETPLFYIKRKIDGRSLDDKVYRARIVIPKESANASAPSPGFIIQKSSSSLDSIYSQPDSVNLSDSDQDEIEIIRNPGVIIDAWTTTSGITTTVNIVTKKPHELKVGNKVNIYNLKSSNEPNPVGLGTGVGYNGQFEVSSVASDLQFTYVIPRSPGTISVTASTSTESWMSQRNCDSSTYRIPPYTIDSSNRDNLPYFTCEEVSNDFQVYKVKTIQKYVQGASDGIYHAYLNVFKNVPLESPFNIKNYKLSQNLDNIYPNSDVDNVVSDADPTVSTASRQLIGKVNVNDSRFSTTKETLLQYLKDFGGGVEVDFITKSGDTCTLVTKTNHQVGGIRQITSITSGSGYVQGVYYDIPLCSNSGNGQSATAIVTINSSGEVSSIVISNPGSGYSVSDILSVNGIPGSTSQTTCVVGNVLSENYGVVQVLGCTYPENNGIFRIIAVTSNSIIYDNASGRDESPSNGVVIPELPVYTVSVVSYDAPTESTTITTEYQNPFLVGSKVLFEGNSSEFVVVEVTSNTTFRVSGNALGATSVFSSGLTSYPKDTNSTNENLGTRQFSVVTGFKARIDSAITASSGSFTAKLANLNANSSAGLYKGDFIQIEDEILLITRVSGTNVSVIRGVLATKAAAHAQNSAIRKIKVYPIELRRNSILRASGHTFEYTGFGPGNYSTGMPSNQDRVLNSDETLISQALPTHGGLVVYTGMNSNGEFFIGRKKYDATTGEELALVEEPEDETSFFDNLTVNSLTVNKRIDGSTATTVLKDLTVGVATITSDLTIQGNTNISGGLDVGGALGVGNTITAPVFVGNGTIPLGGIIMWSGSIATIPSGWALCNGSNGTPNLSNRFVISVGGALGVGSTGGSETVSLTTANMPAHDHGGGGTSTATTDSQGAHTHTITDPGHSHQYTRVNGQGNDAGTDNVNYSRNIDNNANTGPNTTGISINSAGAHTHTITTSYTINSEGSGTAHENMPPYYALAYIMRVL